MADAVASQVLLNSTARLIIKLTNISDGTGESAVAKVVPSQYDCDEVYIEKIHYSTSGMGVDILWDATADVLCWTIPSDYSDTLDFTFFGGLKNNAGTGKNGSVLFTTVGAANGDRYSIILEMRKVHS